jgi:hypothetical protein
MRIAASRLWLLRKVTAEVQDCAMSFASRLPAMYVGNKTVATCIGKARGLLEQSGIIGEALVADKLCDDIVHGGDATTASTDLCCLQI